MKFTLSWLKTHLDTDAPLNRIVEALTALGLEVETVTQRGLGFERLVIARVIEAVQHPNADKLKVCRVDIGSGDAIQVVCGAPNARTGMMSAYAPAGTYIPAKDLTLEIRDVRGVTSAGMLCSEWELGLSDDHEGIIDLPDTAPVGMAYVDWAGLSDPVIDVSLTPDRADCAGVRGIARDLAAAGLGRLKPLDAMTAPVPASFDNPIRVHLSFPDGVADACPMFAGRLIRGVKNGPSPQWLRDRLTAIGLRTISTLVDITNLMTMDVDRPLHVFDAAKLAGDLTVRLGAEGERIAALNGKSYDITSAMTVIADDTGVLSLGGIIGGEGSGCTDETVDVYVEAALFDPIRTAHTGRALGIDSDARYRFERGLDPEFVVPGLEMATRLILDLCGGTPSNIAVSGQAPAWRRRYALRTDRVRTLGGMEVPLVEQVRILRDLGCVVDDGATAGGPLSVEPPSWRADIHGEADLVEEVMRVAGFDRLPAVPLPRIATITRPALGDAQRRRLMVRRALAARGLDEAVTWSFMASDTASLFGQVPPSLRLLNPIASDLDVMRPSILPNLLQAAGRNADRGHPDVALFEVGPDYRTPEPDGQRTVAGGVRAGAAAPRHWAGGHRPPDAFDAKADALAALDAAGAPIANLQVSADAPDWYHPGRSGSLRLGPTVLAHFGEAHPGLLGRLDLRGPVAMFEAFIDAVPVARKKAGTAKPLVSLPQFQPVTRDFAFVVPQTVQADRVLRAVRSADKKLIADVSVFDVYRGPAIGDGMVSLAVQVTIQPVAQTLTDAEIDRLGQAIVAAVSKATGAVLRA